MLLSMVELLNTTGLHYYLVSLSILNNNQLLLKTLPNDCKSFEKKVNLTEVHAVDIKETGKLLAVQFEYENNYYTFIDYGNHVVPFFKKIILPAMTSYQQ